METKDIQVKADEFVFLLKLSEKTAEKLWDNGEDEIWNEIGSKKISF